jgi:hypothetical protein
MGENDQRKNNKILDDGERTTEMTITREQLDDPTPMGCYEIRHELWSHFSNESIEMHQAYTFNGDYIGDPDFAAFMTGNDHYWTKRPIRWVPRIISKWGDDFPRPGRNRLLTWLRWHAWFYVPSRQRQPGLTSFQKRTPESNVCSIGFSERDQKWYGWSHRAYAGFGIGDKVKKGSTCTSAMTGWSLPEGFKAKTLHDAYRMAAAHAESVS